MRTQSSIDRLVEAVEKGHQPDSAELHTLLSLQVPSEQSVLFRAARQSRLRHFGNRIYLYGFLYISTFCRNACRFCHFRQANTESRRYRKSPSEICAAAKQMAASGVHLIDLTLGEDPLLVGGNDPSCSDLAAIVAAVKKCTGLPLMISPGYLDEGGLARLAHAGADWYACYQETHTPEKFAFLRPGQDYNGRMAAKTAARRLGMLIEEGLLTGAGESTADLVNSLHVMQTMAVDQGRAMTFIPQKGTPMGSRSVVGNERELLLIAVMRLLFPDRLIPASLDVEGLGGLRRRLNAGANVVTSVVAPGNGFSGVAQKELDIEDARRTVASVDAVLQQAGLVRASQDDYARWVRQRKAAHQLSEDPRQSGTL